MWRGARAGRQPDQIQTTLTPMFMQSQSAMPRQRKKPRPEVSIRGVWKPEPPCALPFTGAIVNINPMIAASGILAGVWGRFQVRSTPNHLRPLTPLTETIDFGPFERVFVTLVIIEISHGKHPPRQVIVREAPRRLTIGQRQD